MPALENELTHFFIDLAARKPATLAGLGQQPGITLSEMHCCFTLPALFSCLQRIDDTFADVSYPAFRRAIYASPINVAIEQYGARIVIEHNHGHVDKTTYALTWQPGSHER